MTSISPWSTRWVPWVPTRRLKEEQVKAERLRVLRDVIEAHALGVPHQQDNVIDAAFCNGHALACRQVLSIIDEGWGGHDGSIPGLPKRRQTIG